MVCFSIFSASVVRNSAVLGIHIVLYLVGTYILIKYRLGGKLYLILLAISTVIFALGSADVSLTLRFALKNLIPAITKPFDIKTNSGAMIESPVKYQLYVANK